MLDSITKDHSITVDDLTVLLKHFFYKLPEVIEKQQEKEEATKEDSFYYKIAQKYKHDFAKLIVNLERKYEIKDSTTIPKLIRDYLSFRDQVNITKMFDGEDDDRYDDDVYDDNDEEEEVEVEEISGEEQEEEEESSSGEEQEEEEESGSGEEQEESKEETAKEL